MEQVIETKGNLVYDASASLALTAQAQTLLASATDIVIDSVLMFESAGEELQAIKALQKKVEDQRTAITKPMNDALKAVNDFFRAPAQFLVQAEAAIKRPMVTWTSEQERLAAEARREAERLAAAERERLAAIQREQEAAQRRAEKASQEAAKAAMDAVAAGDIELAQELAAEAVAQGNAAEAAMADANVTAMTAEIVTFRPAMVAAKVAGISGRTTYKAETPDLMALAKAVVSGSAPVQCLLVNEQFLGAQARALKTTGKLYGLVNIVAERGISARAA